MFSEIYPLKGSFSVGYKPKNAYSHQAEKNVYVLKLLCIHTYKVNNQSAHGSFLHKPRTEICQNFLPLTIHITSPGNNENPTTILSRHHCSQVPEILTAQHHRTLSSSQSITPVNRNTECVLHKRLRGRCHCDLDQFSSGLLNFRSPALCCGRGSGFEIRRTESEFKLQFTGYVIQGKSCDQVSTSSSVKQGKYCLPHTGLFEALNEVTCINICRPLSILQVSTIFIET